MKKKEGKKAPRTREEIKYIKRYVSLHNKKKSPHEILGFIKSLQRSIVQKLIRKTSPLAKDIETIQDHLINTYKSMRGNKVIILQEKDLARMLSLAGGEKVYPSVSILNPFPERLHFTENLKDPDLTKYEKISENLGPALYNVRKKKRS